MSTVVAWLAVGGALAGPPEGTDPAKAEPPAPAFASETFVLLVKGPNWSDADTEENRALMKGHLAHFAAQAEAGNLLVCGPFADRDDADLRGVCIYRTDVATTRALAEADPRVAAGHLTVKVMTWWHEAGAVAYPQAEAR
jgi:uncharacterized protein YciI